MEQFFQPNSTVLFYGDSVTDATRKKEDPLDLGQGYANKVATVYTALYPQNHVRFLNRGVGGNRLIDLLERYDLDARPTNPDFISILVGINDTWRRYDRGMTVTEPEFEGQYRSLLGRFRSDFPKARILLIEPFLLSVDPEKAQYWEDLAPKIEIVRKLAAELADFYVPTNEVFASAQSEGYLPAQLSEDGVHPTSIGHTYLAIAWLRAIRAL